MDDLNSEKLRISKTSTEELSLAVAKLKQFTQQNEGGIFSSVRHFDSKEEALPSKNHSALKQTIDLVRYFISSTFSEKSRYSFKLKKSQIQKEVSRAIDILKSHYLLIQKFKKGNSAQQELAAAAISAIHHYNHVMHLLKKEPPNWGQKVIRFLYQKSGLAIDECFFDKKINLPVSAVDYTETKKFSQLLESPLAFVTPQKISSFLSGHLTENISDREADAFRVKASSLLKSNGIRFLSISDQLNSIKITPIQTLSDSSSNIVSMIQTLRPFPGETIVLKGSFKREEKNNSTPIPESFEVTSAAEQNGYPHPSQHTGWALSDTLIPYCPLKIDQLPTFYQLYEEKTQIAKELLPQGQLNLKAKEILKIKKEQFKENQQEFLLLHKEFHLALLDIAPPSFLVEQANEKISVFFESFPEFDRLNQVYETIISQFITEPHQILQDCWFEYNHSKLLCSVPKVRFQAALTLLQETSQKNLTSLQYQRQQSTTPRDQQTLDFMICVGSLLASPSHQIILQYFSEIIGFPPPMLNDYEIRIQALAYKQLMEFHLQMNSNWNVEEISHYLRGQLASDIHLLKLSSYEELPDSLLILVNEIEVYYNSIFYHSLNKS